MNRAITFVLFLFTLSVASKGQTYIVKEWKTIYEWRDGDSVIVSTDTLDFIFGSEDTTAINIINGDTEYTFFGERAGFVKLYGDRFMGKVGIFIWLDSLSGVDMPHRREYRNLIEGKGVEDKTTKELILCYSRKEDCLLFKRNGKDIIWRDARNKIILTKAKVTDSLLDMLIPEQRQ